MNRRDWIASAAALGLSALIPKTVFAAATDPTRMVLFWTPNGTVMDAWWPQTGLIGPILEPLSNHAAKLLPVRGIDMEVAVAAPIAPDHLPDIRAALSGHQPIAVGTRWTCPGATVDQIIAERLGPVTRLPSMELAVQPVDRLVYRGADSVVQPHVDPAAAFERLFGDLTRGRDRAAVVRARRLSILDLVGDELSDLSGVLGAEERQHLDAHASAIRDVERAIVAPVDETAACIPEAPSALESVYQPELFPEVGRQMMDVLALALTCDMTRVVTLQWSGSASQVVHTWAGVNNGHHSTSHQLGISATDSRADLIAIERWYASQFAYLLDRLDSTAANSGSVLDHTVAVWLHEQSEGAQHSRRDMPYVFAGKVNGGQRLDFEGVAHNRLLVSLCHKMGLTDITEVGDATMPGGALADLV